MTLTYKAQKLIGLANDTKPPNIEDWEEFRASDTFETWMKIAGTWYETTPNLPSDYIIKRISSSTYKGKNTAKGYYDIQNTNGDIGQLVIDIIAQLPNGGVIDVKSSNTTSYLIKTPITVPNADAGSVKPYVLRFSEPSTPSVRYAGTTIEIDPTFPTSRYVCESISGTASNNTSNITIKGGFVYNPYARSGTTGQNIQGTSTIIDAGLLKFGSAHTNGIPLVIDGITTQYLWRGIHLLGYQYFGKIHNFFVENGTNTNAVTDCDLIMEKGGYTDYPKVMDIQHLCLTHGEGTSGGTGSVNMACAFGGAYNSIKHGFVDGGKYNEAVVAIKQGWSNSIYYFGTIDLNGTQGASFKGTWELDTVDFSGNAAIHSPNEWSTYNNQIYDVYGSSLPYGLTFQNGAYRNRIKIYGYWGGILVIDDVNAGIENIAEIIEGQQPSSSASVKVTTTSTPSKVKIVDLRMGSENRGTIKFNGDGSNKTFNIPHGLWVAPNTYFVRPLTADCQSGIDVSVTSTNIVVNILGGFAPPIGTNNVVFGWYANVY